MKAAENRSPNTKDKAGSSGRLQSLNPKATVTTRGRNIGKLKSAGWRKLWEELHPGPPPPIGHPIPPLNPMPVPIMDRVRVGTAVPVRAVAVPVQFRSPRHPASKRSCLGAPRAILHASSSLLVAIPLFGTLALLAAGCQVLTYTSPTGEHFSRSAFGASVSVSELAVEADTNGLRRVQLQGYQNNSSQILGTVTEAAIRAALQTAK